MKFKNIKKKTYKKKSPSNSRDISEKTKRFRFSFPKFSHVSLIGIYGTTLKVFVIIIFVVAVAIVGYDLQKNWEVKQSVDLQREKLSQELSFWENFIAKHQDYRDAYFQASVLEYRLGNTTKAKIYVEKGLALDPNSENGRKIEQNLK